MTNELTLAHLHDIVEPTPVSAWPPAPGVWFMLGIIVLVLSIFSYRKLLAYKNNAYRRAALAELDAAHSAGSIAEILKRTALVAYPREVVISLRGDAWFQWLETEGGLPCSEEVRAAWSGIYSDVDTKSDALRTFTREWITNHAGV